MKFTSLALLAGAGLVAAGCATLPPSPDTAVTAPSTAPVSLEGKIAECGHPGAAPAQVVYPDGWQKRLTEVAEQSMAQDELLGGPVTTEVVARNDEPKVRPSPTYPATAARIGLEAMCYAMMDVTPSGDPEEILTACSSPAFNAATYEAIRTVKFAPKVIDGRQVRRLNVVYPVQYCLSQ
ncbi:MAG: energy transducer TonB [Pseudomonadota bacterium]|nr:energy transducer TonB [Pseudomonadota bacterium]